ncbi:hypothetical protein CTI12_AA465630 [Artemisia annua]|uniref:RNase H type-1 domain-containing protein n=1 Tax=Artemisia annua TaxID=35608 RepID=A0A2U1LQF5_ARTAN|nr:hypothetical protein CTI12_AA465630 [Artemisia annua]
MAHQNDDEKLRSFLECFPTYQLHSKPQSYYDIDFWVFSSKDDEGGSQNNSYTFSDDVGTLMRILSAFSKKLDLSSSGIIVESDSLNVVFWVRHPLERPWRLLSHFQEIDLFLSTNGNRSVAHIKCEGNCDADKLAKEGVLRSVPLSIWNL